MHIIERAVGDVAALQRLTRGEQDAQQRDRYRVVMLAIAQRETRDIQEVLVRSRGFVQRSAYAYREGGIEALQEKPCGRSKAKLPPEKEEAFQARLDAGPRPEDGVRTLRGKDAKRILEQEFGVALSLGHAYRMLHRLGYSCLKPRPRHEKHNREAQQEFRERAPLLSAPSAKGSNNDMVEPVVRRSERAVVAMPLTQALACCRITHWGTMSIASAQ